MYQRKKRTKRGCDISIDVVEKSSFFKERWDFENEVNSVLCDTLDS